MVSYHRFDAAQLADEEAGASDEISDRDPFAAIRPEDDDLLRTLTGAAPSKLLITSRLIPRVLLNPANQAVPGVRWEHLPGLRSPDAEALIRASGVAGSSQDIQDYLKRHCDCHPLVTGILAGLINDYLPDRGNFDAWAADPAWGGKLNLAELDLIQRRNHILNAAIAALTDENRQLLVTLGILSEAVDYTTLEALNPLLPPEPQEVQEPQRPEDGRMWDQMSRREKNEARADFKAALKSRAQYEEAMKTWSQSSEFPAAPQALATAVRDLERRGLLQYGDQAKRYDLHPVVRGVVAGGLAQEEKERYGQRVVDHFTERAPTSYEDAETLDDVRAGLHVVRALLQMGRLRQAYATFEYDLVNALLINLDAYGEILSLLRPVFPQGWATLPDGLDPQRGIYLSNVAATALASAGDSDEALSLHGTLVLFNLREKDWHRVRVDLSNISRALTSQSRLAKAEFCLLVALDVAAQADEADLFSARLDRLSQLALIGQWTDALVMWELLDPMGRAWPRNLYRSGGAEHEYASLRFRQGAMAEEQLTTAEKLAAAGKDRLTIRSLHHLRGEWHMMRGQRKQAAESLHEAVRMDREVGRSDPNTMKAETQLALARVQLGWVTDPRREASRLSDTKQRHRGALAELWFAIGDYEEAEKHAFAAYEWAWADGEPYVRRYELNKAKDLLEHLGVEPPELPPYDPDKDEKLPWEDEVAEAIKRLRAERDAEENEAEEDGEQ